MSKENKEFASRILTYVDENKRFFSSNGEIYNNLESLLKALKKMKKDAYVIHVNSLKNDFANWIYDVIGDYELAKVVRKVKSKKDMEKVLKERINYLKSLTN